MTNKEFKRLSRSQLIDIIYQFQLQVDKLTEENQELEKALADKRLRFENVGNLAQASLVMNDCFQRAQDAADQYLFEIREMYKKAQEECQAMIESAREEANAISAASQKTVDGANEKAQPTGETDV